MVFQFGEFFNQSSTLNSWLIEFFKVGFAVAMFFVGLYWERRKQEDASKKSSKELRKYVYSIIKSIEKPFYFQIASINEIIDQIGVDDQQDYVFLEVPAFNVKGVKNLEDTDLFKSFVIKLDGNEAIKIENFTIFKTTVEYFDKVVEKSIPEYFEGFYKRVIEFNKEFKNNADAVFELLRRYILATEEDGVTKNFQSIAAQYLKSKRQHDGLKNSFFAYNSAILPLLNMCSQNLDDKRCQEMMSYLINCKTSIEVFERNREFYVQQFTDLLETMKDQKTKLDNSIADLEKLEK